MDDEYIQYKSIDVLSRVLPRPLAYWVGIRVSDRFFYNDNRGRHAVMSNLRKIIECRGISPSRRRLRLMARRTFQNFGKYVVDFFRYGKFTREKVDRLVSIEHGERLDEALEPGNGVLAVTAHYGSWEIGGAVLAALGYPVSAIVLPENNKRTDRLFQRRREVRGIKPIPLGKAARGAMKALQRGEFVAILADRDYTKNNKQFKFFGVPAYLPTGPAALCMRTGASLLPAFLVRQKDDNYLLRFSEPLIPAENETVESIQEAICGILEKEISKDPTQWYMFREFWNYSGDGAASSRCQAGLNNKRFAK